MKANVNFQVCICGHHVFYKRRMIATVSKHGSVRWEIPENDSNNLPVYVISAVQVFAADIARLAV